MKLQIVGNIEPVLSEWLGTSETYQRAFDRDIQTVIADVVMVIGGWLTSLQLGLDSDLFYQMTVEAVNVTGFMTGLVKAAVFGLLIGLIACFLGLSVKPWQGSAGVGKATTNTVVFSIVAIIGADAVFTIIFYAYGLVK